jgi:hypothetical protein
VCVDPNSLNTAPILIKLRPTPTKSTLAHRMVPFLFPISHYLTLFTHVNQSQNPKSRHDISRHDQKNKIRISSITRSILLRFPCNHDLPPLTRPSPIDWYHSHPQFLTILPYSQTPSNQSQIPKSSKYDDTSRHHQKKKKKIRFPTITRSILLRFP